MTSLSLHAMLGPMKTLVTGGVKSGKSTRALEIARSFGPRVGFIATATGFDDEMRERIRRHRDERESRFVTVEEPIRIDRALGLAGQAVLLDCIPLWLNNLFFEDREAELDGILSAFIQNLPSDIVIVTNETGMGVIPADPLSRRYGMALGRVNAELARACDAVELMVSGISLRIK